MAMTPESTVKKDITAGFYECFGMEKAWHTSFVAGPIQQAGRPDYIFVADDHTVWIEAKANRNGLSSLQRRVFARMVASGARVIVVRGAIDELSRKVSKLEAWVYEPDVAHPTPVPFYPQDLKGPVFWRWAFGISAPA